ncbi:MAG: protein kinase domain-containing protein, partial [Planctomycetota bacterium]
MNGPDDPTRPTDRPDATAPTRRSDELGGDVTLTSTGAPQPRQLGAYRIERELGAGGMGIVYGATHVQLARQVALKVMRPDIAHRPDFAERFLREAQAAARIQHVNVVTIHDAGQVDGVLYMAFEFVGGGDLAELIKRRGALPPAEALSIIIACADGLQAIHEAGLVHRDIKPQNIFLDQRGVPKLGDLGLARSAAGDDRMTMTGVGIGTPAYMSPEQAEGLPDIDIRSDIHALGATLYTLLTGRAPFSGATPFTVTKQVMDGDRPRLRAHRPEISASLEAVVLQAMAVDRNERYADPMRFAQALRAELATSSSGAGAGGGQAETLLVEPAAHAGGGGFGSGLLLGLVAAVAGALGAMVWWSGALQPVEPAPLAAPPPTATPMSDQEAAVAANPGIALPENDMPRQDDTSERAPASIVEAASGPEADAADQTPVPPDESAARASSGADETVSSTPNELAEPSAAEPDQVTEPAPQAASPTPE